MLVIEHVLPFASGGATSSDLSLTFCIIQESKDSYKSDLLESKTYLN